MNGTSWAISLLLVVASWTVSHDIPMVLSAEEADEASWLLMVSSCDASGGSAQRMPVVECSKWSRGSGTAKVLVAATSSGNNIMLAFTVPVGWQGTASAAFCRTPGTGHALCGICSVVSCL